MTELEVMQRARMYMELLAQGIDPVSGQPLPQGCGLDQARLGRCFSYVSGILGQVIDNGGVVGHRKKNKDFALTSQQKACVAVAPYPVLVSEFIDILYRAAADPDMKKLSALKISNFLVTEGFIEKQVGENGAKRNVPTQNGVRLGLSSKMRGSRDGEYLAIYYDANAQRYLLEHLDRIMEGK